MHSISTSTFLGKVLTATQLRAGLCVKCFAYSSFMFFIHPQIMSAIMGPSLHRTPIRTQLTAKSPMSARKMLTLTTFSSDEPASARTARRFLMQASVFCWIVPSTRLPWESTGIEPEQ